MDITRTKSPDYWPTDLECMAYLGVTAYEWHALSPADKLDLTVLISRL